MMIFKNIILFLMLISITVILFGFYPEPLIETMSLSVENLISNYNLEINKKMTLK